MYDWLTEALEDSATVVTANRRLARVLADEFATQQLAAGKKSVAKSVDFFLAGLVG